MRFLLIPSSGHHAGAGICFQFAKRGCAAIHSFATRAAFMRSSSWRAPELVPWRQLPEASRYERDSVAA